MFLTQTSSGTTGLDFNNEDQLYQLAQTQGGAVAESANELAHPNTGILSTIGNTFKSAFKSFVDVISIPSEIVAGALDKDISIPDAIKQHESIDQAVFGDTPIFGQEGSQTTMQKIGGFIVRAPLDILLDPTTYLTFGAGNLSKVKLLTQAGKEATEQIAKDALAQGLQGADRIAFENAQKAKIAANPEFTTTSVLNKEGSQVMQDYAQHVAQGTENSFYKNEAIKLVNKSADEFGKPTLGIEAAMETVKNSVKAGEFDAQILRQTIDAPLDIERAKQALGNLMSRKPQMMEPFLDKGGIKYLGRTLLSGQRIASAVRMIPLAHQVDGIANGIRRTVFGINKDTREYDLLESKMADKAKSLKNQAIQNMANIFTANGLTSVEADLVTAAIEHGKMPMDPKLRDVYLTSLGIDTGEAVINGDTVASAIRQVQKANKMNYQMAIDAGIPLTKREHYMMHLAELKDLKPSFSNISPTTNLKNAKFASVQKFTNLRTGETIVGKAEQHALDKYDPNLALNVLKDTIKETEDRYGIKMQDIQHQSIDVQDKITNFFVNKSTKEFTKLISDSIPGAKAEDIASAARVFKENLPNLDFDALKSSRAKALSEAETGVGELLKTSTPKLKQAVQKLLDQNKRIGSEVPELGSKINDILSNVSGYTRGDGMALLNATDEQLDNITKELTVTGEQASADSGVLASEAKDFVSSLRKLNKNYSDALLKHSINDEQMSQYMDKLVTEFDGNQVGVRHLLDALLGKDNKMAKMMLELSDKRKELLTQQDSTGALAMMDGKLYRSKQGEIFRAARPTIQEANAAGFHFETNALPIMIHSSINTIRATVSKEFINEVAAKWGALESQAPDGWKEVNVSGLKDAPANLSNWLTGKNGEKIVFHPEIAKRIENFSKSVINDEDINEVLKKFDQVTSAFKASVTSIFPAFHGRNAISNVLNSFLDIGLAAVNPARHVMAAQIANSSYSVNGLMKRIAAGDGEANALLMKELSKDAFTDKRGYTWSMGQIHQLLKDKNIALGNQFGDRIEEYKNTVDEVAENLQNELWGDEGLSTTQKVLKRGKTPISTTGKGLKAVSNVGQKVGQSIEDHSRMIHFLEHLNRTGDADLAAQRTKMFLFDYGDLSNFEKTFLKRLIPFYTWTKKNVELQVRTLVKTPGRITTQLHAFNTLSSVMSNGNGLTDEEYNQLPDYMKDQFNLVTKRNGQKLHVLSNLGSPLEAAFNALQPNTLLSSVNPFVQLPAELLSGYDAFQGGMMSDTNNAALIKNAPQIVKDLSGFVSYSYKDKKTGETKQVYSALNPKMFFFLMNQPFGSRVFKQILHSEDTAQANTSFSSEEVLRDLTGIQSKDLDFESLTAQAQKKRVAELQDLLTKAGVIYKIDRPVKSKTTLPQ